ncbi:radical SAM protein [Nanoarchaeota archaeon]
MTEERYLDAMITTYCPKQCKRCISGSSPEKNTFLPVENFKSVIKGRDYKYVVFTGGEPTAHPQFNEFLDSLNFRVPFCTVYTNGYLTKVVYNEADAVDFDASIEETAGVLPYLGNFTEIKISLNRELIRQDPLHFVKLAILTKAVKKKEGKVGYNIAGESVDDIVMLIRETFGKPVNGMTYQLLGEPEDFSVEEPDKWDILLPDRRIIQEDYVSAIREFNLIP